MFQIRCLVEGGLGNGIMRYEVNVYFICYLFFGYFCCL